MTDTITIACQIGTTDASATLGFEAWIDDRKFFDTDHVAESQAVSMEICDDPAEHELIFVLKNKIPAHTRIDDAGNIISDASLIVSDITFEEIPLGNLVNELAVYQHNYNGTADAVTEKFYAELGCNGTVSLKFTTPVYLWLLDRM